MRIALVCTDREASFADPRRCPPRLRGLAEAFAESGHEVVVLAAGPQPAFAGVAVRELRLPVTAREVDWHFAQIEPELVIAHWLPGHDTCVEAAAEARLPLLLDIGSEHLDGSQDDALRAMFESTHEHAGVLVAHEREAARVRALAGSRVAVHVIEDAVRPALLEAPEPVLATQVATRLRLDRSSEVHVAFVGPLTRESGAFDVLRALASVTEERALDPAPRLLVAGDGPARNDLLALALEHGVRVTLCGRVAEDEVGAHLAPCAIVVAGSGGGPLPLLQAMACERPVIAFDTPDHRRVAEPGREACFVSDGDVAALASTIGDLLAVPDRALRLARAARLRVAEAFTWPAQAERLALVGASMKGVAAREAAG